MFEIFTLSIPEVNWLPYIKASQDVLGFSPTRGLDQEGISPKQPAAFLATLDFKNQPGNQLRKGVYENNSFDHYFISFGMVDDTAIPGLWIANNCPVDVMHRAGEERHLFLISGTMRQWYSTLITCQRGQVIPESVSIRLSHISNNLRSAGFGPIWEQFMPSLEIVSTK
jgi:hypothetical protein